MTDAMLEPAYGGLALGLGDKPIAQLNPGSFEVDHREVGGVAAEPDGDLFVGPIVGALHGAWTARRVGGQDVWELSARLENGGAEPMRITRMDAASLTLDLSRGHWRTTWFRSAWGDEFRPQHGTTRHDTFLDVRSGRSSHGAAPWLGLELEAGDAALIVTPAWSGNWHIDVRSDGALTAGISRWQFFVDLQPGEAVAVPSVVIAAGTDLDAASIALQRAVRDEWMPRTAFTDSAPVEWNHWWPYEDAEVDERVILDNAREAAAVGFEVATVDAGWFGAPDAASDWQEQRGDWSSVNTERFPSGLEALGAGIAEAGVLPGIWIEAEAVGSSARLRAQHPGLLARAEDGRRHDPSYRLMTVSLDAADPAFLGYVCLGSEAGRAHVYDSMCALIERFGARWVKLDFNIDPDAGCTRTDHGHGAGDGLLRHYEGLYAVLDAVRERFPDLMLESCSSGGLRIDLGLARHVHGFFLSDPDYTEHHLEVLMGAARMLPPLGILHWSQSQWRGDYPPQQLDWAALDVDDFDTMVRVALVHRFGVSVRLVELAPDLKARLAAHVAVYRDVVRPVVRDGVLRALTPAPERGGLGERAPALQLSDEASDRHVVLAVVLAGGERPPVVRPLGLRPDCDYTVTDLGGELDAFASPGADLLARGIPLEGRTSITSWLFLLAPTDSIPPTDSGE
jgi:alpha-galactosidase